MLEERIRKGKSRVKRRVVIMFNRLKDPLNAEVEAEVEMLREVLYAVNLSCNPCEKLKNTEYRTFLISRLKHVPEIIEDLKKENGDVRRKLEYVNRERERDSVIIRRLARKLAENGINFEDVVEKL